MQKLTLLLVSLGLLVISGCTQSGFKRTKTGLMYKIISDEKSPVVKPNEWLKIHVKQTVHDSLLGDTHNEMPIYLRPDTAGLKYDPREIFPMLRKGDSAVMVIAGDSILAKQGRLPEFMKRQDKIIFYIKVLDILPNDSAKTQDETVEGNRFNEKQAVESAAKREETVKEIEAYLAENKISYQKAPKGTYVVIKDPGTGPKAEPGKVALVKYSGKLFKTDKVFDSSDQGYPVTVGSGGVIVGWDESLPYFAKGGKGTLYVPFFTGYGPGPGPEGKTYANMVFDIEILDVRDGQAPPAPGNAPIPQQ